MNIFISWSGERSRQVAECLKWWLQAAIHATTPWISTKDIERGAMWSSQIGAQLKETSNGIICLTRENQNAPWILFEAGALAKGLETSRIYTLLIDLNPEDVRGPLAQFNHTKINQSDIEKLVYSINANLANPIEPAIIKITFDALWPKLEKALNEIINKTPDSPKPPEPSQEELSKEIISTLRNITSRLNDLERPTPRPTNDRTVDLFYSIKQDLSKKNVDTEAYQKILKYLAGNKRLGENGDESQ